MKNNDIDKAEALVSQVRQRYASIAKQGSSCCGPVLTQIEPLACGVAGRLGYDEEALQALPEGADLGLGCGAPVGQLDLQPGEVVLDLGSGAGLDVFLASPLVGPEGKAIGVDMTGEMLEKARRNAVRGGYENVEFRQGRLEELPLEDESVDAVTSNCVINLVPDKSKVFREIARVLRPGGRVVISDIILDGPLPTAIQEDLLAYVGCIAGAQQREAYFSSLHEAGLGRLEILKDQDYLEMVEDSFAPEVELLLERTATPIEQIQGIVRSVTFRAWAG